MGLYVIDDASGRIGALHPGAPGYAAAALARRHVIFTRGQRPGVVRTLTLPANTLFAYYLVQNDSSADFLARNPRNLLSRQPQVFFSITAANPDHVAHIVAEWRVLFGLTAVLLALTEALGSGLAFWRASHSRMS